MQPRIYHGKLTAQDLARALIAQFNRGNLQAQQIGQEPQIVVQIATRNRPMAGGQTALSVILRKIEDGVTVQMGQQQWLGTAASLGETALRALRNPWNLLNRLDDLAQDLENIQLSEQVWGVIEKAARAAGASHELSERLRRMECEYCGTGNPVGEGSCIACGAPLGRIQPKTCKNCGFVLRRTDTICPNCKRRV
jgi:hypothetical protein